MEARAFFDLTESFVFSIGCVCDSRCVLVKEASLHPDFNPIEMAFSKFKAYLKRRAARTVTELWEAIAQATDIFTSAECQNYFVAAGYDRK